MGSENPSGAGNQQGSLEIGPVPISSIPQRLHAELLEADARETRAYVPGALRESHGDFIRRVGSWHPRKRLLLEQRLETRMKI